MGQNRGEWSELYALAYLLLNTDAVIFDNQLIKTTDEIFKVNRASVEETEGIIKFNVENNGDVSVYSKDEFKSMIEKQELDRLVRMLFKSIIEAPASGGSFEIPEISSTLSKMTRGNKIKAKSTLKEDLTLNVYDLKMGKNQPLKYSIKSMLGSPATLLNSSSNTNFIYEVSNINDEQMIQINNINTRTKLLDRYLKIKEFDGAIKYVDMESPNFKYNLKMIDSNMPKYMADVLLKSYAENNKNLKELFLKNTEFDDEDFALTKLGQLLEGISFGFFPNKKWDGKNIVDGGLIIVKPNAEVGILDLVYEKDIVRNYLIDETKLDSPSATRYHMFEIYKDNGKYYFKLNLQIRYKH